MRAIPGAAQIDYHQIHTVVMNIEQNHAECNKIKTKNSSMESKQKSLVLSIINTVEAA